MVKKVRRIVDVSVRTVSTVLAARKVKNRSSNIHVTLTILFSTLLYSCFIMWQQLWILQRVHDIWLVEIDFICYSVVHNLAANLSSRNLLKIFVDKEYGTILISISSSRNLYTIEVIVIWIRNLSLPHPERVFAITLWIYLFVCQKQYYKKTTDTLWLSCICLEGSRP